MKNLHLVCNAHIDPVWLWEIEEGIAETLSTYRVAADFCEEYDSFVFCHNEAMLYMWVEENDPALFARIQKLVKEKKWHIMGGWYLQPDANMPSGESFVRQILLGKLYFMEKFGVEPNTAVGLDAFGHSRGIVDIMAKSGFDSYVFCRPEPDMIDLPAEDFYWVGFDGSKIACHRAYNSYESHRGEADEKIMGWIKSNPDADVGLVLWGIGDHGGGPSRIDYEKIKKLNETNGIYNIIHSTPEAYFGQLASTGRKLPEYKGLLNPRYTGCYTTQMRTKKLHRKLENELFLTEKMAAHAYLAGVMDYPAETLRTVTKDLMMLEFHDILPGSAIEPVEEYSASLAGHGLTELKNIKIKAFLALCSDKPKAQDGTIPVFVYNPNPFDAEQVVEVEYQLPDQNKNRELFALPHVYKDGVEIPSQCEHEVSNFNVDWRKRSVFKAFLKAGDMTRFDVKIELIKTPDALKQPYDYTEKAEGCLSRNGDTLIFDNGTLKAGISLTRGTVSFMDVNGEKYLIEGSFTPVAVADDENSWAFKEKAFPVVKGEFVLADKKTAAELSGIIDENIPEAVRIIENGDVRVIIEAIFTYKTSYICRRYYLSKTGSELKVTDKVYFNEKMTMLKLRINSVIKGEFIGQTAYGSEKLLANGDEMVSQKWNVISDGKKALSVINDCTYGSDYKDGVLRVTMLRSPGYSAGKSDFSVRKKYIMEQDRFSPYIDQGMHDFEFRINASDSASRMLSVEREAYLASEKIQALSFFPTGCEEKALGSVKPFAVLSDNSTVLSVFKKAERGEGFVIRLFNPTDAPVTTVLSFPALGYSGEYTLGKYEIKTVRLDTKTKTATETDLLERTK